MLYCDYPVLEIKRLRYKKDKQFVREHIINNEWTEVRTQALNIQKLTHKFCIKMTFNML